MGKNKAVMAAWRERNKEKISAYNKEYRARRAEYHRERRRKYYEENKEHEREQNRAWCKANAANCARRVNLRRAKKLQASPQWLSQTHESQIEMFYQTAASYGAHVDHIVPLQGKDVCGLHVPWNLQVLDEETNLRKKNKLTKEGEQLAWTPANLQN